MSTYSLMARPTVIRAEDIIAAAREVFLARGFRATTAEVAKRACVSEGSIFKRFKTKFDLFRAAMVEVGEPAFLKSLPDRVGKGDIDEQLVTLGHELLDHLRILTPLIVMAWSNPADDGTPCTAGAAEPPPVRMLRGLSGYFEAEMRIGRLRRHDPEIMARALLGATQHYVLFQVLCSTHENFPLPEKTFVRGLVHLVLEGARV